MIEIPALKVTKKVKSIQMFKKPVRRVSQVCKSFISLFCSFSISMKSVSNTHDSCPKTTLFYFLRETELESA